MYQVDKALTEYGDKVPQEERDSVQRANDDLKEALKGDDVPDIKSKTEALMQAFQKIGQAMYAQQQAQGAQAQAAAAGGGTTGTPEGGSDGDVVEGEIVDEGGAS